MNYSVFGGMLNLAQFNQSMLSECDAQMAKSGGGGSWRRGSDLHPTS